MNAKVNINTAELLNPRQLKLKALLERARAQIAASTPQQVEQVMEAAEKVGATDIDVSNIVPATATEEEKDEALDVVISSLPVKDAAVEEVVAPVKQLGVMRNIELNAKQRLAADKIVAGESIVMLGKAGTGKTTMMRTSMIELIASGRIPPLQEATKWLQTGLPGALVLSYTNKAVNNIRHAMPPEVKAHTLTIHKVLEFEPTWYEVLDEETGKEKKVMRFEPTRTALNPLPEGIKFVAIEEASMCGTSLFNLLTSALPHDVQFLFIGDIRQLPPVFDQAILGYKMLELPVVELTDVYRQALLSPILRCALTLDSGEIDKFRAGKPHIDKNLKKYVWPNLAAWNETGEHGSLIIQPWQREVSVLEALGTMRLFFKTQWEAGVYNPEEDIILCPMQKQANELGQKLMSCYNLNALIADFLSKAAGQPTYEIIAGFEKRYWAVGDRVLYQKEDAVIRDIKPNAKYLGREPRSPSLHMDRYGVVDGERAAEEFKSREDSLVDSLLTADGVIDEEKADKLLEAIGSGGLDSRVNQASHEITVFVPVTGIEVKLTTAGEVNELLGGYALTVHKAQGSEWNRVYLVIHNSHKVALSRELVYTAMTRARNFLHIFIHPDGLANACRNQRIKGNTIEEKAEFFKGKRDKGTIAKEDAEKRARDEQRIADIKAAVQGKVEYCMARAKAAYPDMLHDINIKTLFMACGSAAGQAILGNGRDCIIKINPVYLNYDFDEALEDTIPHEIAHLYANRWYGCKDHSKDWQDVAVALGARPDRYHDMPPVAVARGIVKQMAGGVK